MKTVRIAGVQGFYGDSPLGALAVVMSASEDYICPYYTSDASDEKKGLCLRGCQIMKKQSRERLCDSGGAACRKKQSRLFGSSAR